MPTSLSDTEALKTFSTFQRVKVKREDLLKALLDNKKAHDDLLANALKGYYKSVKKTLSERIKTVLPLVKEELQTTLESVTNLEESVKPVVFSSKQQYALFNFNIPFPESHEDDYNRAIQMVKLSANDLFELSEDDFSKFVMNDWSWKNEFLSTSQMYCSGMSVATGIANFSKKS